MLFANRPSLAISAAIAAANLLALADWPYGYYQLLRIAVTAYAAWLAYHHFEQGRTFVAWSFGFVAVLYNPIVKIHMERSTHEILNIVLAVLVLAEAYWGRQNGPKELS